MGQAVILHWTLAVVFGVFMSSSYAKDAANKGSPPAPASNSSNNPNQYLFCKCRETSTPGGVFCDCSRIPKPAKSRKTTSAGSVSVPTTATPAAGGVTEGKEPQKEGQEVKDWDYDSLRGRLDPPNWYKNYPTCNGKRQSPISIECSDVVHDKTLKPLEFINYNKTLEDLVLFNDGFTVKVNLPKSAGVRLRSGSLPGSSYRLVNFHFHWGLPPVQGGSEHIFSGKQWPLELHLVHFNEDIPDDQVKKDKNGIVVVLVEFHYAAQTDEETLAAFSEAIDELTQVMDKTLLEEDQNITSSMKYFAIQDLLPPNASMNYLTYEGSLTTPPCSETVTWVILTRTMIVTADVMGRFLATRQKLKEANEESEASINERPAQPINGRKVRFIADAGDLIACD